MLLGYFRCSLSIPFNFLSIWHLCGPKNLDARYTVSALANAANLFMLDAALVSDAESRRLSNATSKREVRLGESFNAKAAKVDRRGLYCAMSGI